MQKVQKVFFSFIFNGLFVQGKPCRKSQKLQKVLLSGVWPSRAGRGMDIEDAATKQATLTRCLPTYHVSCLRTRTK